MLPNDVISACTKARVELKVVDGSLLYRPALTMPPNLAVQLKEQCREIVSLLSDGDGPDTEWPTFDDCDCSPCRRCGLPILFSEITSDTRGLYYDGPDDCRKWLILDPDLSPHACGSIG